LLRVKTETGKLVKNQGVNSNKKNGTRQIITVT